MVQLYNRANQFWQRVLWWLVIGSLLLTLPVAIDRYRTEHTSKMVEFVFDYRDLLEISETKANPRAFVDEQLTRMRQAGVHSLAVYESTLNELQLSRRVELYNSRDALALMEVAGSANENFAYVLFSDADSRPVVEDMIRRAFDRLGVGIRPWSYKGMPGLVLEMPLDDAVMKPMIPDPITLQYLQDEGFGIIGRLGNRNQDFTAVDLEEKLTLLQQYGVASILVDGESVPGYSANAARSKAQMEVAADLFNQYGMAVAAIELLGIPQRGVTSMARAMDYNVIRLHSLTEGEAARLAENITEEELESRIRGLSDRLVLAVKDRNIRLVFLNARVSRNLDRGIYTDPLEHIYESLSGSDGAVERLQELGFTMGKAHSFTHQESSLHKAAVLMGYIGAVLLMALTFSYFVPGLSLLMSMLGLAGTAALHVLSPSITEKLLTLGAACCAASLGTIAAIRYLQRKRRAAPVEGAWWKAIITILLITAASSLGMAAVVSVLSSMEYMLQIDQFRGVKVLAYMPVAITALYLVFFSDELTPRGMLRKVGTILDSKISVLGVVVIAVIGSVGLYYLSRTGNEGSAAGIEIAFRNFLESTLGVRPRTKEFLFAHPLLILGVYLCLRRRMYGLWLMVAGVIGQASAIGSFTHLHTPLWISFVRVLLGLGLGIVLGLVAIVVWQLVAGSWKRWVEPLLRGS